MKYFEYDPDGYLVGWYESDTARQNSTTLDYSPLQPCHARFVGEKWVEDKSKQDLIELNTARQCAVDYVQDRLDNLARSWGYDNIISGASYSNSKIPKFKAEGEAMSDLRDATWVAVTNNQHLSTLEELIAVLPPLPVRPA